MRLGVTGLLADGPIGERVGVLTHPAAVLPDLSLGLDALIAAGQPVVAVFGAEHGLRGTAQAGFSEAEAADADTGLPVYDTYAMSVDDVAAALSALRIDTLVVDLQHAGTRFYTYESTLYDAIAATHRSGTRLVVLDRPNPLGGVAIGGPMLQPEYASFVGRAELPIRHGLTMGELGGYFADLLGAARPSVVPMAGWRRGDLFDDTGLIWVPPSPNLPTAETAYAYPGTCLFEGTNISVGRGTTTPFRTLGAPWLDGALAARLRGSDLPGVAFRDTDFAPAFNDYAGEHLRGLTLHVTDPRTFDPIGTAVVMLAAIADLYPGELRFRPIFDKLAGSAELRAAVASGAAAGDILSGWRAGLASFDQVRTAYQLY
jgi:uncharacterized protein YbbC (DUF1343 family)